MFIPTASQFTNQENPSFSLRNRNHSLNSIAKSQLPNLGLIEPWITTLELFNAGKRS
jgi:hypothetical protein